MLIVKPVRAKVRVLMVMVIGPGLAGFWSQGLYYLPNPLSCDLGIAKPAPEPFLIACERLGVSPERTLMVGNNRVAGSGSICVGCHCLILPPVPPGATRGLRAADTAGLPWPT